MRELKLPMGPIVVLVMTLAWLASAGAEEPDSRSLTVFDSCAAARGGWPGFSAGILLIDLEAHAKSDPSSPGGRSVSQVNSPSGPP